MNDDQTLRESLVKVLTDATYRQELSRAALEGAERFDLKQTTASWENLLLRLVGAGTALTCSEAGWAAVSRVKKAAIKRGYRISMF